MGILFILLFLLFLHSQNHNIMSTSTILIIFNCLLFGVIGALMGRYRKIGPYWSFLLGVALCVIGLIIISCFERVEPDL
jgi:hypothetical protein